MQAVPIETASMSKKMSTHEHIYSKRLGENIAERRKAAGLTQEQVADKLELGKEAISRIERGDVSPTAFRVYEFAKLFETPIQNFFTETSRRPLDQAERIAELIKPLSVKDRGMILAFIEKLSDRLKKE